MGVKLAKGLSEEDFLAYKNDMKLNLSLSDKVAKEIRQASKKQKRPMSTLVEEAWSQARGQVLAFSSSPEDEIAKQRKKAETILDSLTGFLKKDFPNMDSVTLCKQAFFIKPKIKNRAKIVSN